MLKRSLSTFDGVGSLRPANPYADVVEVGAFSDERAEDGFRPYKYMRGAGAGAGAGAGGSERYLVTASEMPEVGMQSFSALPGVISVDTPSVLDLGAGFAKPPLPTSQRGEGPFEVHYSLTVKSSKKHHANTHRVVPYLAMPKKTVSRNRNVPTAVNVLDMNAHTLTSLKTALGSAAAVSSRDAVANARIALAAYHASLATAAGAHGTPKTALETALTTFELNSNEAAFRTAKTAYESVVGRIVAAPSRAWTELKAALDALLHTPSKTWAAMAKKTKAYKWRYGHNDTDLWFEPRVLGFTMQDQGLHLGTTFDDYKDGTSTRESSTEQCAFRTRGLVKVEQLWGDGLSSGVAVGYALREFNTAFLEARRSLIAALKNVASDFGLTETALNNFRGKVLLWVPVWARSLDAGTQHGVRDVYTINCGVIAGATGARYPQTMSHRTRAIAHVVASSVVPSDSTRMVLLAMSMKCTPHDQKHGSVFMATASGGGGGPPAPAPKRRRGKRTGAAGATGASTLPGVGGPPGPDLVGVLNSSEGSEGSEVSEDGEGSESSEGGEDGEGDGSGSGSGSDDDGVSSRTALPKPKQRTLIGRGRGGAVAAAVPAAVPTARNRGGGGGRGGGRGGAVLSGFAPALSDDVQAQGGADQILPLHEEPGSSSGSNPGAIDAGAVGRDSAPGTGAVAGADGQDSAPGKGAVPGPIGQAELDRTSADASGL